MRFSFSIVVLAPTMAINGLLTFAMVIGYVNIFRRQIRVFRYTQTGANTKQQNKTRKVPGRVSKRLLMAMAQHPRACPRIGWVVRSTESNKEICADSPDQLRN